jgi:hypothetical protein
MFKRHMSLSHVDRKKFLFEKLISQHVTSKLHPKVPSSAS